MGFSQKENCYPKSDNRECRNLAINSCEAVVTTFRGEGGNRVLEKVVGILRNTLIILVCSLVHNMFQFSRG